MPGSKSNHSETELPSGLFPAEFRSLLSQLTDEPFRTIAIASGCLGLRKGEVVALQWGDFSTDFSTLTIHPHASGGYAFSNKDASHATLPLCPQLIEVFTEFKSRSRFTLNTDWVFATRYDPRFHVEPMRVLARIRAVAKFAFLRPLNWHTLRYTLATTLVTLGFDLWTVCQLMRKKNIDSTLLSFNRPSVTRIISEHGLQRTAVLRSAGASGELRAAAAQATHILLSNTKKELHQC